MGKRGRKPTPEEMAIHELCLDYWVNFRWSHAKIAKFLFDNYNITHTEDSTQPVHRTTVMRYIRGAAKRLDEEQRKRQGIEKTVVIQELDGLKQLLHRQRMDAKDNELALSFEETVKLIDADLKILDRRIKLLGLDAPAKTQAEITHHGEVETTMDPKQVDVLERFEQRVRENDWS